MGFKVGDRVRIAVHTIGEGEEGFVTAVNNAHEWPYMVEMGCTRVGYKAEHLILLSSAPEEPSCDTCRHKGSETRCHDCLRCPNRPDKYEPKLAFKVGDFAIYTGCSSGYAGQYCRVTKVNENFGWSYTVLFGNGQGFTTAESSLKPIPPVRDEE